jgi:hypothetical protein
MPETNKRGVQYAHFKIIQYILHSGRVADTLTLSFSIASFFAVHVAMFCLVSGTRSLFLPVPTARSTFYSDRLAALINII